MICDMRLSEKLLAKAKTGLVTINRAQKKMDRPLISIENTSIWQMYLEAVALEAKLDKKDDNPLNG